MLIPEQCPEPVLLNLQGSNSCPQSQSQSRAMQYLFSLCTAVTILLVAASTVRLEKPVCTSTSSDTVCALDLEEEIAPGGSSRASSKCVNAGTAFGAWHHGAIICPEAQALVNLVPPPALDTLE